ncbi:MAG: DNA polymerase III subunit gamma/tau [Chitinophagales bacterium]|nr:DNA polymerase III subunit gamma/tau [Chitinophagales bacterium]MDW8418310.1 DNA polymerase III subunit gamma/tau [Chitinophagales bacterium]
MADYIVSARKYRPARFSEMLGQEQVATTLKNAIRTGHLAHSFLFCGPRGVGKTTAARILAKTINCENITADYESCGMCQSCLSFQQNTSFNIYELDAASNNSVDDIRALVEQVRFPPQSGKYKIYIIDEVHMLSQGAFNAFLKTLEEPPAYCKFILATTEKHKILPTILSRCQIFDFRRISTDTIVNHLKKIAEAENVQAEEDALHVIAQKSDGSMRDALSMFDRLCNYGDGKLTYVSVLENLNVLDYDYYFKVTDALLSEDVAKTFCWLDEVIQKGFEGDDFLLGLCEHFRHLLFCKDQQTVRLLECSDTLRNRYAQQAARASADFLVNCLRIGNEADVQYKQSKNKRLTVEIALIKMCYVNVALQLGGAESKKKLKESNTQSQIKDVKPESGSASTQSSSELQVHEPAVTNVTTTANNSGKASKPAPPSNLNKKFITAEKLLRQNTLLQNTPVVNIETDGTYQGEIYTLNEQNLDMLWKKFAEELPDDNVGLRLLMNMFTPALGENNQIFLTLASDIQQAQFEPVRFSLQKFLTERTNTKVSLIIQVNKQEAGNKKPYLPQEQLELLMAKNPAIKQLIKQLNLELD